LVNILNRSRASPAPRPLWTRCS